MWRGWQRALSPCKKPRPRKICYKTTRDKLRGTENSCRSEEEEGGNKPRLLAHSLTHDHSLRELGQELPEGDSVQEAVLMMLGRRVEVLKQRLQHMEKEHRDRLTAGEQTLPDCTAMLCRNVYSYNCGVANLPARCTKCKYIIIMLETLLCAQP